MVLLDFFTKTSRKEPKYYTWRFRAGSVSSVSGPASMASWTLAPMSFSAGRRAMEKTASSARSLLRTLLLEMTQDLPSPFGGSTSPVGRGRAG